MTGNRTADVAIIGAGAAGIGAALTLKRLGRSFIILEASHRIGGRGYTEEIVPGVPFDLGCHWLHSASINPLVKVADEFGISYSKQGYPRASFTEGRWNTPEETAEFEVFYDRQERRMQKVADGPGDCSIYEATEREHRWSGFFDYFTTLDTSHDADEVSVTDLMAYNDTEENWCLKEGYGTLLVRLGGSLPVTLNSAVSSVDWSGSGVKLETARGTVSATKALITVSTGMLSAGDIRFTPDLPDWKHEAVAALPLGNQNRICL
ncbi:MAG: FAD-dependent oxidoreductase, partial [Pseudomonadota bacterium]